MIHTFHIIISAHTMTFILGFWVGAGRQGVPVKSTNKPDSTSKDKIFMRYKPNNYA